MTDTEVAGIISESTADPMEVAMPESGSREEALSEFWRIKTKRMLTLVGILVAVVAMFVIAMLVGPLNISAADIASTYLRGIAEGLQQLGIDAGWAAEVSGRTRTVVMELRTPPALMAVVAGAALALAGAQMQTILDNPLAEPYTLGVSAAAGCGAAIVIATGISFPFFSEASVPIGAAALALVASGVIALVSRLRRSRNHHPAGYRPGLRVPGVADAASVPGLPGIPPADGVLDHGVAGTRHLVLHRHGAGLPHRGHSTVLDEPVETHCALAR